MFGLFKARPKYLADIEYWVYVPRPELPGQDQIMDLALRGDVDKGIRASIEPREGTLLSDIRLSVALILRSKNPHVFRPDLMGDEVPTTSQMLSGLADSTAIIKVRYLSEEPLTDVRHLKLLPNLAVSAGTLADASVVYDVQKQALSTFQEFVTDLRRNADAARPDFHVRSLWKPLEAGGQAETRGLVKVGLKDFATKAMNADEQVLVTSVVDEAARQIFALGRYPEDLIVETFGDRFRLVFDSRAKGPVSASILRLHDIA